MNDEEKRAELIRWLGMYRRHELPKAITLLRRRAEVCGNPDVAALFEWAARHAEAMHAGTDGQA